MLHVTGSGEQGCNRAIVWVAGVAHHQAAELACIPAAGGQQAGTLLKGSGPLLCNSAKVIKRCISDWFMVLDVDYAAVLGGKLLI